MNARLVEFREIAPQVRNFVFEAPEVDRLPFVPGQFFSFTAMIDGDPITRAYSIASAPDGNRFELCLNMVEDGLFSPYLFAMRPGDTVDVKGPYGTFIFRKPLNDAVLVATGTGIAPFRSMLRWQLPRDPDHRYTLIFGVRYEHGLLYRDEFEAMAGVYANFRFVQTLTRPESTWTGQTGRVQPIVLETIGERRDIDVYICGLREMVDETRAMLKGLGFDRRRIIFEKYD